MSDYVPQWPERELEDPTETSHPAAYPGFIPSSGNGSDYHSNYHLNCSYQQNYHHNPHDNPHHYNLHNYNHRYNQLYSHNGTNAAFRSQRPPAAQHSHENGSGARLASSSTNPTFGASTTTNSSWEVIGNTQGGNGEDNDSRFGGDESHVDESSILSTRQPGREFACPFQLHGTPSSPTCRHGFKKLSYVRQHIFRRHIQPIHCPICGETFKDDNLRNVHINQESCKPAYYTLPGLSRDVGDRIIQARSRAPPHTASDHDRWYMMWDILFPHDARPAEPYLEGTFLAPSVPAVSVLETPSSEASFADIAFGFLHQGGGRDLIQTIFPDGAPNAPPGFLDVFHQILEDYTKGMVEYAGRQNRSDPP
ncbi:hypothetical protein PG991_001189 [Apiospora marii]|uniref:C2H2-type domain-containing protein n=1 Tax=Apiospora marii TaxID=335849 RepID=A0ABR1SU37_9PEZI